VLTAAGPLHDKYSRWLWELRKYLPREAYRLLVHVLLLAAVTGAGHRNGERSWSQRQDVLHAEGDRAVDHARYVYPVVVP
jgi:hypothetical protein